MARTKMKSRAQKRGGKASKKNIVKKTKMTKAARTNDASIIKKMEKEFMQTPAKMAAQLNKAVKALKQQEAKLKSTANKQAQRVKSAEGRLIAADKNAHTSAGKKRFKVVQKKHAAIIKANQGLSKQLDALSDAIAINQTQQAKYKALTKQLIQFNKDWANSEKTNIATTAKKIQSKKRAQKDVEIQKNNDTIEDSQADEVQTLFDEISLDESTENAVG